MQQYAHSAFEADTDNVIDSQDVKLGATRDNGALQQLGLKYFHDLYFDRIGSDEYRSVLRAMAEHLDDWVSRSQMQAEAKVKAGTLNNAITALKNRHIILAQPGKTGKYRLPTKSFAVWIRAFTRATSTAQSGGSPELTESNDTGQRN